ncbi:nuclear transport factor 2 family protein [Pedobacter sp. MC2016-15]|uniref:nuclear transport factor 2 family protein n=1 Tax=Pedobacter sp. MC2016-15 TaxID=2994473 RepID=UPI002247B6E0|nr:nuclear transport factor 2 family protein [Pedobacter sp. MC2016-15]MCX2480513.1 nuclear transport factor 2 family protein [Pedobacter sp. MC2016-15]
MRRFLFFVLILIASLKAAAQTQQEQQRIQAPLLRFFDAMAAIQPEALRAEVTPDFYLLENGKIWNTDSLTNSMNRYKGLELKRVNKLDFLKTEQIGNTSLVSYHNTAELNYKGKQFTIRWLESAVLLKDKGNWKIRFLHSTELKPVAESVH